MVCLEVYLIEICALAGTHRVFQAIAPLVYLIEICALAGTLGVFGRYVCTVYLIEICALAGTALLDGATKH